MAPPPDPSSTMALPPASNLELRVYESLGLDAAIGKSCVQQQKQLAATAPARRRAKPAAAHKPSLSKPRDAATRDDMATLRLAERELQAARRREATAARDRDALAEQLEAARAKARANALEKAAMPRVPERPRARRVEANEAPAKLSAAQAQALDLRMRRRWPLCELAALRRRARCPLPLQTSVSLHARRARVRRGSLSLACVTNPPRTASPRRRPAPQRRPSPASGGARPRSPRRRPEANRRPPPTPR